MFYNPLISSVGDKLVTRVDKSENNAAPVGKENAYTPIMRRVQYRGHATDRFIGKLRKVEAPILPVLTTRKLRSCLPSLKTQSSTALRSRVVYKITCPGCGSCYVGCTTHHFTLRVQQHRVKGRPIRKHFDECNEKVTLKQAEILDSTIRNDKLLLALEALYIRELSPQLNTRDEYRSRKLTLKL